MTIYLRVEIPEGRTRDEVLAAMDDVPAEVYVLLDDVRELQFDARMALPEAQERLQRAEAERDAFLQRVDEVVVRAQREEVARRLAEDDLTEALDAMDDVMASDKGLREEDWVEWCNQHLPLLKRHGRQKYTVEFL